MLSFRKRCEICNDIKLHCKSKEMCDDCVEESARSFQHSLIQKLQDVKDNQIDETKIINHIKNHYSTKTEFLRAVAIWIKKAGFVQSSLEARIKKLVDVLPPRFSSKTLQTDYGFSNQDLKEAVKIFASHGFKHGRWAINGKQIFGYKKSNKASVATAVNIVAQQNLKKHRQKPKSFEITIVRDCNGNVNKIKTIAGAAALISFQQVKEQKKCPAMKLKNGCY